MKIAGFTSDISLKFNKGVRQRSTGFKTDHLYVMEMNNKQNQVMDKL